MSVQHLDSKADQKAALEEYLTPDEESAQAYQETPDKDGDNPDSEESWDDVNSKLKGDDSSDDDSEEMSELERLKAELEAERKERATAEKRMKDSQRAFRERSEELKRIQAERQEEEAIASKSQQLKEDVASGDIASPQTEKELEDFAKEYGLTEEEKEFFELYPEGMSAMEKLLSKRMDTGLSEREAKKERQAQEDRAKALEQQLEQEEEVKWISGVKTYHKDAESLLENAEFNSWLKANDGLRQTILSGKERFDPTGLVEIIDHYKEQKAEIDRVRQNRAFNRQSSVSPASVSQRSVSDTGEKSWAQINAELKKQRSRS